MDMCVVGNGYVASSHGAVFVDLGNGRTLFEPKRMRRLRFTCYSIGRKPALPS